MLLLSKTQFGQKESFTRPVGASNEDKKKTKLSNTEILCLIRFSIYVTRFFYFHILF